MSSPIKSPTKRLVLSKVFKQSINKDPCAGDEIRMLAAASADRPYNINCDNSTNPIPMESVDTPLDLSSNVTIDRNKRNEQDDISTSRNFIQSVHLIQEEENTNRNNSCKSDSISEQNNLIPTIISCPSKILERQNIISSDIPRDFKIINNSGEPAAQIPIEMLSRPICETSSDSITDFHVSNVSDTLSVSDNSTALAPCENIGPNIATKLYDTQFNLTNSIIRTQIEPSNIMTSSDLAEFYPNSGNNRLESANSQIFQVPESLLHVNSNLHSFRPDDSGIVQANLAPVSLSNVSSNVNQFLPPNLPIVHANFSDSQAPFRYFSNFTNHLPAHSQIVPRNFVPGLYPNTQPNFNNFILVDSRTTQPNFAPGSMFYASPNAHNFLPINSQSFQANFTPESVSNASSNFYNFLPENRRSAQVCFAPVSFTNDSLSINNFQTREASQAIRPIMTENLGYVHNQSSTLTATSDLSLYDAELSFGENEESSDNQSIDVVNVTIETNSDSETENLSFSKLQCGKSLVEEMTGKKESSILSNHITTTTTASITLTVTKKMESSHLPKIVKVSDINDSKGIHRRLELKIDQSQIKSVQKEKNISRDYTMTDTNLPNVELKQIGTLQDKTTTDTIGMISTSNEKNLSRKCMNTTIATSRQCSGGNNLRPKQCLELKKGVYMTVIDSITVTEHNKNKIKSNERFTSDENTGQCTIPDSFHTNNCEANQTVINPNLNKTVKCSKRTGEKLFPLHCPEKQRRLFEAASCSKINVTSSTRTEALKCNFTSSQKPIHNNANSTNNTKSVTTYKPNTYIDNEVNNGCDVRKEIVLNNGFGGNNFLQFDTTNPTSQDSSYTFEHFCPKSKTVQEHFKKHNMIFSDDELDQAIEKSIQKYENSSAEKGCLVKPETAEKACQVEARDFEPLNSDTSVFSPVNNFMDTSFPQILDITNSSDDNTSIENSILYDLAKAQSYKRRLFDGSDNRSAGTETKTNQESLIDQKSAILKAIQNRSPHLPSHPVETRTSLSDEPVDACCPITPYDKRKSPSVDDFVDQEVPTPSIQDEEENQSLYTTPKKPILRVGLSRSAPCKTLHPKTNPNHQISQVTFSPIIVEETDLL